MRGSAPKPPQPGGINQINCNRMYSFYYDGKQYVATSKENLIAQLKLIDADIDWEQGLHDIEHEEFMTYDTSTWETDFNSIVVKLDQGKFLTIHEVENESLNDHVKVYCQNQSAAISNTRDNFSFEVTTSRDGDILGVAEIVIIMPDGNRWKGTIQDFMAIAHCCKNAFAIIVENQLGHGDEMLEMQTVLGRFGIHKTIPAPDATQDRGKEMALIATIMSHNFFDEMVAESNSGGVIACYDRLADWAAEFYKTYKDFDWDEMKHANNAPCEWPEANGWEDVVICFTRNKMSKFK